LYPKSRIPYSATRTAELGGMLGTEAFGKRVAGLIGWESVADKFLNVLTQ
jgi:hypothetical protein